MWRESSILISIFIAIPCVGETIDLVCTDPSGYSVTFEIDPDAKTIQSNGISATAVHIDRNEFNFTLPLNGEDWFHIINRTSGTLVVHSPNKATVPPYTCMRAKPQF